MAEKLYRYGELYWVKFDEETVGTEIRGPRPGLIISVVILKLWQKIIKN